MKRILVITNNLEQASYRLRIQAIVPLLRERGVDLDVHLRPTSILQRRPLLRSAADYHAVLLQRKLLDPSDARLLRCHARRILYDIDDAVMHPQSTGLIARWRTSRRFTATARIIDHVVAGNQYLADIFRAQGKAVTVLPTSVDPRQYPVKQHIATTTPTLVWIGSHSTLPYLRQALPTLESATEQIPGLRLLVIADQAPHSSILPISLARWSAETEATSLLQGDIGIAPTPDDPWTRGKSGFKIIQYMAAGLPVLASPVGANCDLVSPGQTGFLPSTPSEWTTRISELSRDPALRARLGAYARQRISQRYSLDSSATTWATLLND